jgi:hypothetical protein
MPSGSVAGKYLLSPVIFFHLCVADFFFCPVNSPMRTRIMPKSKMKQLQWNKLTTVKTNSFWANVRDDEILRKELDLAELDMTFRAVEKGASALPVNQRTPSVLLKTDRNFAYIPYF